MELTVIAPTELIAGLTIPASYAALEKHAPMTSLTASFVGHLSNVAMITNGFQCVNNRSMIPLSFERDKRK